MSNAYKTAIMRKVPSAPMRWLNANGCIVGRALDYGSGRGFDAWTYHMSCYDPHYQPHMPEGPFETITCNYVLNVIELDSERVAVLQNIQSLMTKGSRAYITVRNDKAALKGTTHTGSWQGLVVLALPVVHKCAGYVIYELPRTWGLGKSIQAARTY